MRTYFSGEVAQLLGISPNTLRKWSLLLENAGCVFLRDDKNNRAYKDSDILTFRKLQDLLSSKMSMENAVIAVASIHLEGQKTTAVIEVDRSDERYSNLEKKFDSYIEQQTAFQQALLSELKKRDEYIDNALRTRDERLTQTMSELLETKRLIAAAQEQPKKKWYQFWK